MLPTEHPEYAIHSQRLDQDGRIRAALAAWQASGEAIDVPAYGLRWTPETARNFVLALSAMFVDYNDVLWKNFSYCQVCAGACCAADASHIEPLDHLALALLEEDFPRPAEDWELSARRCIYLRRGWCAWPERWRTFKCWAFFCLGPPRVWQQVGAERSLGERHNELCAAARQAVERSLPPELRAWERVQQRRLGDALDESPVGFGALLNEAVEAVLVSPLRARYPF